MKKVYLFLLVFLGIHLFLLFNLKFTAWPEMLSYAYFRNNGYLLYKDMIHPYPPVLTMALSIIYELFGYRLLVLKIFTWSLILTNDILVFLIVKKITGKHLFAFLSLIFYISIQPFLEGNQLWFDLAIVPAILLSIYYILQKKYFWSGLLLGIAILTKQTTGLFLIFWALLILIRERRLKPVINLIIGPVILFVILLVRLFIEGAVSDFFNWTLIYPFIWWNKFPGYVQMALTHRDVSIIGLLFAPLFLLVFKLRKQILNDQNIIYLISSTLVSLILVYPRFSFFHFQIVLVFIAVLFGYLASKFNSSKKFSLFSFFYFVLIALLIIKPKVGEWRMETRFWGRGEEMAAEIIREKTKTNDLVYLLGPQSNLYVLSGRFPPKPWADNFGWYLEIPNVQEEMVKGWEGNKPGVVFMNNIQGGNWYDLGTYRPQKIVDWIKKEKITTINLDK